MSVRPTTRRGWIRIRGASSCKVTLNIAEKQHLHFTASFSNFPCMSVRSAAQPEWLQVMSDSEVEISSELHWSCMAAGKPRPSVRWLRNGQPLTTQVTRRIHVPYTCADVHTQAGGLQRLLTSYVQLLHGKDMKISQRSFVGTFLFSMQPLGFKDILNHPRQETSPNNQSQYVIDVCV